MKTLYQIQVDALIPEATAKARAKMIALDVSPICSRMGAGGSLYNHDVESELFHEAMNNLKEKAGLIYRGSL